MEKMKGSIIGLRKAAGMTGLDTEAVHCWTRTGVRTFEGLLAVVIGNDRYRGVVTIAWLVSPRSCQALDRPKNDCTTCYSHCL
ncbi:hypothetical protein EYF80_010606 [Liparis tanakae]|uniref:Uncharacterized protein n=1 Tax=Liparis tanakae TaxID=230148 RepID=A0A4Z2IN69_9TELE|nr:hypothetical protein EYF80_010606 [Liparis tanakae]